MSDAARLTGVAGALVVAVGVCAISWVRAERGALRDAVCEAAARGEVDRALALSQGAASGAGDARVVECRAWALIGSGRIADGVALLEARIRAEPDWLPEPRLLQLVLLRELDAGRMREAAALSRSATAAYPRNREFITYELVSRSAIGEQAEVLREMEARIDDPARDAVALRMLVASSYKKRGHLEPALRALGEVPPRSEPDRTHWFELRGTLLGSVGSYRALVELYQEWAALGADPLELRARFALTLDATHLRPPGRSIVEVLESALAAAEAGGLSNEVLLRGLYARAISNRLGAGDRDAALALYDRAPEALRPEKLARADIVRGVRPKAEQSGAGTLVFRIRGGGTRAATADESGLGRAQLWVSPDVGALGDAPYTALSLDAADVLRVERRVGPTPVRWVLKDEAGRTRASGTVWPAASEAVAIAIDARDARGAPARGDAPELPKLRAGDGRRRVLVIVLDCADWRLAQYLRVRGDLPFLDAALDAGYVAALDSDPAFTGAAMTKLVSPGRRMTFAGWVYYMGVEIAGLASVGQNPFAPVRALLSEGTTIFEAVGAGDRVAANMLFSHGDIEVGPHAELHGPRGVRRRLAQTAAFRPLREAERGWLSGAIEDPEVRSHVERIAAELDAAVDIARGSEIDLLLLRVEPLDLLTHGLYRDVARDGQDDAAPALYSVYRYLDHRLRQVYAELDADDVLIVMSDHGIRNAMEHERDAIFVALGPDIPAGRAPGSPGIHGVPRYIAALLGIATDWPSTGLESP